MTKKLPLKQSQLKPIKPLDLIAESTRARARVFLINVVERGRHRESRGDKSIKLGSTGRVPDRSVQSRLNRRAPRLVAVKSRVRVPRCHGTGFARRVTRRANLSRRYNYLGAYRPSRRAAAIGQSESHRRDFRSSQVSGTRRSPLVNRLPGCRGRRWTITVDRRPMERAGCEDTPASIDSRVVGRR